MLVNIGLAELGQGLRTAQAQMAADGMGVSLEHITMAETNTASAPATGACIASRGTFVGGGALKDACDKIHNIIAEALALEFNKPTIDIVFENDRVRFAGEDISFTEAVDICYGKGMTPIATGTFVTPDVSWDHEKGTGAPYRTYTYSCHAAEVEVDVDTGEVTVVKMAGCHDMGRAVNPVMAKGQIYGGMAMA